LVRWISNPEAGLVRSARSRAHGDRYETAHVLREVSEEDTARPPKVDSCRAAVYNDALALACSRARTHARRGGERRTREKRKAGRRGGKRTSCRSRCGVKRDARIRPRFWHGNFVGPCLPADELSLADRITKLYIGNNTRPLGPCGCIQNMDNARAKSDAEIISRR
ncbi:hypothetical protein ALC62_01410, partial [Cyphomyrmex costatus]